jgi:hypothetical protein
MAHVRGAPRARSLWIPTIGSGISAAHLQGKCVSNDYQAAKVNPKTGDPVHAAVCVTMTQQKEHH